VTDFIKQLASAMADEEKLLLGQLVNGDVDYTNTPASRVLITFEMAERFWAQLPFKWRLRITARGEAVAEALARQASRKPDMELQP
jgi:plasmid maintenance system antidote protein VapI